MTLAAAFGSPAARALPPWRAVLALLWWVHLVPLRRNIAAHLDAAALVTRVTRVPCPSGGSELPRLPWLSWLTAITAVGLLVLLVATIAAPTPPRLAAVLILGCLAAEFAPQLARRLTADSPLEPPLEPPLDPPLDPRADPSAALPAGLPGPVVRVSGLVGAGSAGVLARRWLAYADATGFTVVVEARDDHLARRYERAGFTRSVPASRTLVRAPRPARHH